uniref:ATP-binding protein n=1 Tax=Streptomyces graminilatus TaxID=1464070 RepID=UPI001F52892B
RSGVLRSRQFDLGALPGHGEQFGVAAEVAEPATARLGDTEPPPPLSLREPPRRDARPVVVTVRDDGPGIPEGRLAQAEGEGRLGVAQSIRGRLRDLGGDAELISVPGQGTEVELTVPKDTRPARRGKAERR